MQSTQFLEYQSKPQLPTPPPPAPSPTFSSTQNNNYHVLPPLWARAALIRGEDRSCGDRDGDDRRDDEQVLLRQPHPLNTADMAANRLNQSCVKKCVPPEYREGDLNKGESVCLDRCVSKFFDVQMKVSEKMQGDAAMRQGQ